MTSYEMDRRINNCFHGETNRSCGTCPAYRRVCCYGEQYDSTDNDCINCIHHEDCRRTCIDASCYDNQAHSNVQVRGQPAAPVPSRPSYIPPSYSTSVSSYNAPRPTYAPQQGPFTPINNQNWEPAFIQLAKDFAWKMVEGGVESLFHFLRNHRWM